MLPSVSMYRANFNMVWWNFQENYSSKRDINDWKWIIDSFSYKDHNQDLWFEM